jgi:hypothetical protein
MVTVKKYSESDFNIWNSFVAHSKNGTFLIDRNYLDYHSTRFIDYSLLFYFNDILIAVMPANLINNELYTHGGITYGGIITNDSMTTPLMVKAFEAMLLFLSSNEITLIYYKCVPSIYHQLPAEEDLYALFINNGQLFRRDVLSVINLQTKKIEFQKRRQRAISKAIANNITIIEASANDWQLYWELLGEALMIKHGAKPVHSLFEIDILKQKFSNNIKLFVAKQNGEILAGVVMYETHQVAHAQYIAANEKGKMAGALDLLFEVLINEKFTNKAFFDFGISNENNGLLLNTGLIEQKEGFGARTIVHDYYKIKIEKHG